MVIVNTVCVLPFSAFNPLWDASKVLAPQGLLNLHFQSLMGCINSAQGDYMYTYINLSIPYGMHLYNPSPGGININQNLSIPYGMHLISNYHVEKSELLEIFQSLMGCILNDKIMDIVQQIIFQSLMGCIKVR
ncbi:hypothetical protein DJ526_07040 [Sulfolobus sp. A20-N-G8]|nr:hypothetical protein DJ526_07040 [Sulfolobus sp. A20-N-G8]